MAVKTFFISLLNYFRAITFLIKNNLWKYFLIPGIISFLLIIVLVFCGFIFSGDITAFLINNIFSPENTNTMIEILLNIFIAVVIFTLGLLIYRPLALILLSPFLSILSEKTEKIISNETTALTQGAFFKDLQRSIRINMRYFLFSSFYSLGAIASGFLPFVGTLLSTFLLFLIQAYYGGSGLADIILERRGLTVKERLQFIKDNRLLIIGSGAGFFLLLFIPIIGWFIAPGLGTVATTMTLARSRIQTQ